MFHLESMRLDDPSGNGGRGWRRLESDEVAALAYIAIRLAIRGVKADLAGRNADSADKAARKLSEAVSARLAAYPTFGPDRPPMSHSARCQSESKGAA
jgi:hypothetical protein